MSTRGLIRLAERDGWSVSRTNGGHVRLEHPEAAMPVFISSTPSDYRATQNALAMLKRALPPEDKPPAERKRAKKRRPKLETKPRLTRLAIDLYAPPQPRAPRPTPASGPSG